MTDNRPHTEILTVPRKPGQRRWRLLNRGHAKRLPKGLKPDKPGALVQIDTLFVNVRPDRAIKHFTAYDPVAKWTVGSVATRTTAQCATALLDKLIAEAPFKIEGIQVDGGSEFCADFEAACQDKGLALFVLPPKRPQLNGATGRTMPSTDKLRSSISRPSATRPLSLICAEPGQMLDLVLSPC